jgi:hypothetical protein
MEKLSEIVYRYRYPLIVFFVFLGILGFYLSTNLSVDSNFLEVLPSDDPVVEEYLKFSSGEESEYSYIVLKSYEKTLEGREKLLDAAKTIFENRNENKYIIGFSKFDYLTDLGPLGLIMVDSNDLNDLSMNKMDLGSNYMTLTNYDFNAIRYIVSDFSRLENFEDIFTKKENVDSYKNYIQMPDETPDDMPLILVMGFSLTGKNTDIGYTDVAIPAIRQWLNTLLNDTGIEYGLVGDHVASNESHMQANKDFLLTTLISLLGIAAIVFLAYSSFKITLYLFLSLSISMFITLGISYLIFGSLNIVTTFLNAITLGLGIDYGIHIMTRMMDEAKSTEDEKKIIFRTYKKVTKPLIVSMSTTVIVFIILLIVKSPALKEMGILTSIGISVFFSVMYLFLPAVSIKTISKQGGKARIHKLDNGIYMVAKGFKKIGIILGTIILSGLLFLSFFGFLNISDFSYTPPGLISEDSEIIKTARLIEKAFKGNITDVVKYLASDYDELVKMTDYLKNNKNIKKIQSALNFVEDGEEGFVQNFREVINSVEKVKGSILLEGILKKEEYYDFIIEMLDEAENIKDTESLINLILSRLPNSIKDSLYYTDENGKSYYVISVEPTSDLFSNNFNKIFFESTEDLYGKAIGYPKIFYYLMNMIRKQALPISVIALITIFFVVWLERKAIFDSLKVLVMMILILISMFGFMYLTGIDVTFITVLTAPLIIGIGVDGIIHMVHASSKGNTLELSKTIKSVTMSSLTSIVAFISFGFAEGKLLKSFGLSLAFGVFLAWIVAIFIVPVLPWRKEK